MRQLTLYALVGVIGTLLDVTLFWLLVRARLSPPVAVTAAFFSATAAQFFLNRYWTFRALHRSAIVQAPVYAIVTLVNWLITLGLVQMGIGLLHLSPLAAKAISIPPTALAGFLGNRFVTFAPGGADLQRPKTK